MLDCVWNVMAHAQKPDFVFRRNGRVHLNRQGASVQSTTGSRGMRIGGSNAGYTMFRGSVKGTGYPLNAPFSPSLLLPCVTVCHHVWTGLYHTITSCSFILLYLNDAVFLHYFYSVSVLRCCRYCCLSLRLLLKLPFVLSCVVCQIFSFISSNSLYLIL